MGKEKEELKRTGSVGGLSTDSSWFGQVLMM